MIQPFRPLLQLHRTHPETAGLHVLAEVEEEAELELLPAVGLDVLILGLWPSSGRRFAGGGEVGQQLIRVGKTSRG